MQTLLEREVTRQQAGEFGLDPSQVLYLPLHMLDGSSFMSRDRYGHLCTVTGAVWGIQGRTFDGDDLINCGSDASLNIRETLTVEAWVKQSAFAINATIAAKWNATSPRSWILLFLSDNTIRFDLNSGGSQATTTTTYGTPVWLHVVGTYDRVNNKVYVNGAEEASAAYTTILAAAPNEPNTIGCERAAAPITYFNGVVGELRIYNRTLSPLKIQHNYLATKWRYQ